MSDDGWRRRLTMTDARPEVGLIQNDPRGDLRRFIAGELLHEVVRRFEQDHPGEGPLGVDPSTGRMVRLEPYMVPPPVGSYGEWQAGWRFPTATETRSRNPVENSG